jgi:hypothetical protein
VGSERVPKCALDRLVCPRGAAHQAPVVAVRGGRVHLGEELAVVRPPAGGEAAREARDDAARHAAAMIQDAGAGAKVRRERRRGDAVRVTVATTTLPPTH